MMRPKPEWYQPPLFELDQVMIDGRVWIDNEERLMQFSWKVHHPVTDELLGMYVEAPQPLMEPGRICTSLAGLLLPRLNEAVNPF